MDYTHSLEKAVVARDVVVYVFDKHQMTIDRRTAGRALKKMGLTWTPIQTEICTYSSYCQQEIKNYLVEMNGYHSEMERGVSKYVFVFVKSLT